MKKLLLIMAFIPSLLFSQSRKQRKALAAQQKVDQQIITNFKNDLQNLSNENSTSKTSDNSLIRDYISGQFKMIGLQPKGTDGYIQPFKTDAGKQVKASTFLKVNGILLSVKKDYFPLSYSAEKSVAGTPVMALREKGVPWFADVKEWLDDDVKNAAEDVNKRVQKEAERAALKGATALFIYNSSNIADNLYFNKRDKLHHSPVPVIYITPAGFSKYFNDPSQVLDIELNVAFEEAIKKAYNIAGFIDNGAPSNIVIAAPFDHYEMARNENTAEEKTDTADIVSGTSMLIELARMLTVSKAKNSNYTFIAYSGEDVLSQSAKWVNGPMLSSPPNYIINLASVGRYDENKKLLIDGYGTSSNWIESVKPLGEKTLEISADSSNLKGRDTSLQQAKVPVLSFSTGAEYSKTIASRDKINYEGELHIAKFILRLIESTNAKGKLAFAETNETQ